MSCVGNSKKVIQANTDSITVAKQTIPLDADSLRILKELYGGSEILQSIDIGNFTTNHTFDFSKKLIKVSCTQNSANHELTYVAIFKDTAKIYSESQFVPSDEYKYIDSYVILDSDTLRLKSIKSINDDSKIEPINIWYGKDFGIAGRYYKLSNQEVFLLRGLNMYCNVCSNYTLLVIQKNSNGASINHINTNSYYPIDFENTLLHTSGNKQNPVLYVIKRKSSEVHSKKDLEKYQLNGLKISKIKD
jgi:hypothetical protein